MAHRATWQDDGNITKREDDDDVNQDTFSGEKHYYSL